MDRFQGVNRSNLITDLLNGDSARWYEWRGVVQSLAAKNRGAVSGMPSEWRMVLYRLKRRKLLEQQKRGGRLMIRLTDRGRYRALVKALRRAPDHYRVGEGCVVLFDIPETERAARNLFRYFLKECGFRLLQRSVWVSRKNVATLVAQFVKKNKLKPWIQVIEGRIRT